MVILIIIVHQSEPQQDVPAEDIEIEDTLNMMSSSDYSQTLQYVNTYYIDV